MDKGICCFTKVVRNRRILGEYIVRAYNCDHDRLPDADYFTEDRTDARDTARIMELNGQRMLAEFAPENLGVEV